MVASNISYRVAAADARSVACSGSFRPVIDAAAQWRCGERSLILSIVAHLGLRSGSRTQKRRESGLGQTRSFGDVGSRIGQRADGTSCRLAEIALRLPKSA